MIHISATDLQTDNKTPQNSPAQYSVHHIDGSLGGNKQWTKVSHWLARLQTLAEQMTGLRQDDTQCPCPVRRSLVEADQTGWRVRSDWGPLLSSSVRHTLWSPCPSQELYRQLYRQSQTCPSQELHRQSQTFPCQESGVIQTVKKTIPDIRNTEQIYYHSNRDRGS